MNIVGGEVIGREQALKALDSLYDRTGQTLSTGRPNYETVINACDRLSKALNEREHLGILLELGMDGAKAGRELAEVKAMLSREYLVQKIKTELGRDFTCERQCSTRDGKVVRERTEPLGVLLHIAAGNAHGLPVFSVIEGLLAGNINILKLPGADDGISSMLLLELMAVEPALTDYIYVFDFPSEDAESIQKMAACADAVVVWGSDAAVEAVRRLADVRTRIIEWGHKISFAYVTQKGIDEEVLRGLARNICSTEQLLCSACHGIFIDGGMDDAYAFCERFLPLLESVSSEYPRNYDIAVKAQLSLELRTKELESVFNKDRIYRGGGCSLLAIDDKHIGSGLAFRNCWVRALPRENIIDALRMHKNHLQTVGLLCGADERPGLADVFLKTGVVRVTTGEGMSEVYAGQPHDGEYALRRYVKITSYD